MRYSPTPMKPTLMLWDLPGCERVVDLSGKNRPAQAVRPDLGAQQRGEVSAAEIAGRNRVKHRERSLLAQPLISAEDERLVALLVELGDVERPPGGGPKLIALELRPGNVSRVVEEIVRVQVAVAQEFKDVAMEGVAAGSGDGVHYVAHAPAVLGRESVGLNLEFLGFVNRRNIDDAVPVACPVPVSVQEEGGGSKAAASGLGSAGCC